MLCLFALLKKTIQGNLIGDDCENDTDGDGVINELDHCPEDPLIQTTSLENYQWINLDPSMANESDPIWEIKHDGQEVRQLADTRLPLMLVGACEVYLV